MAFLFAAAPHRLPETKGQPPESKPNGGLPTVDLHFFEMRKIMMMQQKCDLPFRNPDRVHIFQMPDISSKGAGVRRISPCEVRIPDSSTSTSP